MYKCEARFKSVRTQVIFVRHETLQATQSRNKNADVFQVQLTPRFCLKRGET